MATALTD